MQVDFSLDLKIEITFFLHLKDNFQHFSSIQQWLKSVIVWNHSTPEVELNNVFGVSLGII